MSLGGNSLQARCAQHNVVLTLMTLSTVLSQGSILHIAWLPQTTREHALHAGQSVVPTSKHPHAYVWMHRCNFGVHTSEELAAQASLYCSIGRHAVAGLQSCGQQLHSPPVVPCALQHVCLRMQTL